MDTSESMTGLSKIRLEQPTMITWPVHEILVLHTYSQKPLINVESNRIEYN